MEYGILAKGHECKCMPFHCLVMSYYVTPLLYIRNSAQELVRIFIGIKLENINNTLTYLPWDHKSIIPHSILSSIFLCYSLTFFFSILLLNVIKQSYGRATHSKVLPLSNQQQMAPLRNANLILIHTNY